MKIEKAKLADAIAIRDLILYYSKKGYMLYRPKKEIEYWIRDYLVCRDGNKIVGCVGLKVWDNKNAEIYGLAVKQEYINKGVGTNLVKSCMKEARKLGNSSLFALTFRKDLLLRIGFKKITLRELPRIMFTEKTVNVDKAYGIKIK